MKSKKSKKSSKTKSKPTKLQSSHRILIIVTLVALPLLVGTISAVSISINNKAAINKAIKDDRLKPLSITNLTYCNGEKLDLFVPERTKPVPVLIYIHGGGWEYGSKVGDRLDLLMPLVKRGFAVASINYRLSRTAKFPAQIQDTTCAIRFLRDKAPDYKLDSSKVGLIGLSAGGHLAAIAANAKEEPVFKNGDYQNQPSAIQAMVSISGVLDLEATDLTRVTYSNIDLLLEGSGFTRQATNPTNYISPDDPPQLLIYGTEDPKVPASQTLNYYQRLLQNNVQSKLLRVEYGEHSLHPYFRLSTNPSKNEIIRVMDEFLTKNLK